MHRICASSAVFCYTHAHVSTDQPTKSHHPGIRHTHLEWTLRSFFFWAFADVFLRFPEQKMAVLEGLDPRPCDCHDLIWFNPVSLVAALTQQIASTGTTEALVPQSVECQAFQCLKKSVTQSRARPQSRSDRSDRSAETGKSSGKSSYGYWVRCGNAMGSCLTLHHDDPWCVGGTVNDGETVSGIIGWTRWIEGWNVNYVNWNELQWTLRENCDGLRSYRSKITARPWTLMVFSPDMTKPKLKHHFADPNLFELFELCTVDDLDLSHLRYILHPHFRRRIHEQSWAMDLRLERGISFVVGTTMLVTEKGCGQNKV